MSILLRPYQREACTQLCQNLADTDCVQVLSLPPGAGKTLTANAVVASHLEQTCGRPTVLWVTLNWELLKQAAANLKRFAPRLHIACRAIGGLRDAIAGVRPSSVGRGRIFYTTLQTFARRLQMRSLPAALKPSTNLLVVYDECHWAAGASIGRRMLDYYLGAAKILGLSATPPADSDRFRIAYSKSYADLTPDYLVEPVVENVWTGVEWRPLVRNGMIDPSSLAELSDNRARDEFIVAKIIERWQKQAFSRLIIFAASVRQASHLKQLLSRRGLAAGVVHSGASRDSNRRVIERFRTGRLSSLLNVAMLTEGFDLPEIDAVAVTHPVGSPRKMLQIVGRGSRPAPGKDCFRIFEFVDNVGPIRERLIYPSDAIGLATTSTVSARASQTSPRHNEPEGEPQFENLMLPGMESLSFVVDQTFGVEIEITGSRGVPARCDFEPTGQKILNVIKGAAQRDVYPRPVGYGENDHLGCDRWYVGFDSSAGWEVISPILKNREGFRELQAVTTAIDAFVERSTEVKINYRTGLHITLATRLRQDRNLCGFVARLQRLEPGLFTLVAPSRLYGFFNGAYDLESRNRYCFPVRESLPAMASDQDATEGLFRLDRFHTVNLQRAWNDIQLLEVRMHNGTTDFVKIAPWICLWMHIFNHSRYRWSGTGEHGPVFPGGNQEIPQEQADREDIFQLLQKEGIVLGGEFERLLRNRRSSLAASWERVLPRRFGANRAGWSHPPVAEQQA